MRPSLRFFFLIYLAVMAIGVFGPEPGDQVDRAAERLSSIETQVRERLGVGTSTTVGSQNGATSPTVVIETAARPQTEKFFNVLLFVPFGLLLPFCWPWLRWAAVPIGAAVSVGIEMVQGQFLSWRSQTSIDMDMNWLGTLIGFGVWVLLHVAVSSVRAWRDG